MLTIYWDQQLPLLVCHGFPSDFDRISPSDTLKIIPEERVAHKAILCPFKGPPIEYIHTSHFMTRNMTKSAHHIVLV